MPTVREWLEELAKTTSSTDRDSNMMQNFLRANGFPRAIVIFGLVYIEGYGPPMSIHSVAETLLEEANKEEQTNDTR